MIGGIEAVVLNAAVTIGAVYGGLKMSMNGLHKSQERIEKVLGQITLDVNDHGQRIVRLETKMEDFGPP